MGIYINKVIITKLVLTDQKTDCSVPEIYYNWLQLRLCNFEAKSQTGPDFKTLVMWDMMISGTRNMMSPLTPHHFQVELT